MPSAELPVDAKVYRMPRSYLVLATVGLLLFGFGFVSLLVVPILKPEINAWLLVIPGLAVTGGLSALSLWLLRACQRVIGVTAEGIWYGVPSRTSLQLFWEEISTTKERPFMQRLVIGGRNAQRRINLDYQLENFDELLALVLEKTPNRQDVFPKCTLFHASRWVFVFLVGLLLFCAWLTYLSFVQHADAAAWFFVVLDASLVWIFLVGRRKIQIRQSEIILESWLRRRSVSFAEICGVHLRVIVAPKGGRSLAVFVERGGRKPIMLGSVREGSITLYESLLYHWRNASGFA